MIGALVGINSIPSEMILKVIRFDCTNIPREDDEYDDSEDSEDIMGMGKRRPEFLSTRNNLFPNIQKILEWRPMGSLKIS
tara:strand:+ start:880 stop:1119 length:240 start_codon:yes stop_codon:yes gene_type:complete